MTSIKCPPFKKSIPAALAAAVVLLTVSCMTWRTKEIGGIRDAPGGSARIMTVFKMSGERVVFAKSDPGRVRGQAIEGTALARFSIPLEIKGPFDAIKERPDGSVYEITDGAGRVHQVYRVLKRGDAEWSILVNDSTARPVSIPLADVRQIQYKKPSFVLSFLAITVPLTLGLYAGVLISLASI